MNGPQSNESCHFRVKTGGLLLCNSKTKTLRDRCTLGAGGGPNSTESRLKLFLKSELPRAQTSPPSQRNYNWDKPGTHAGKLPVTKISGLVLLCVLITVRTDLWRNKETYFPRLDYYISWALTPLTEDLGEGRGKKHSTLGERCHYLFFF